MKTSNLYFPLIALAVALIGVIFLLTPAYADAPNAGNGSSGPFGVLWTFGEVGDRAGPAGIVISDVDNDGETETITCAYDSPYFYRYIGESPTQYYPFWYGERLGCSAIAIGDADDDGLQELYVGSRAPIVYIHHYNTDTLTYERTAQLTLAGNEAVNDITVADVDEDDALELVVIRDSATTVYDAQTLTLEWNLNGQGGSGVQAANVDNDSALEIIVNGTNGYILNAVTQSTEHTKPGGWGRLIEAGDTDNDGRAEIVYIRGSGQNGYVGADEIEANILQNKWEAGPGDVGWMVIGEADSTIQGVEVLTGDLNSSDDDLAVRSGITGKLSQPRIPNPGIGTFGMGYGDSNDDGVPEVWWGSYHTTTFGDQLFVADLGTREPEWTNRDYEGPFLTAEGDVDNDGNHELVALSYTSGDAYYGGVYLTYDATTFREEVTRTTEVDPTAFIISQLDDDPALELAIGGQAHDGTSAHMEVIDGITTETQWTLSGIGTGGIVDLKAENIDVDSRNELFVATPNRRVYVYDGASNTIQWQGGPYATDVVDLEIADADDDGVVELGVLTQATFYIYNTQTWALEDEIVINKEGYEGSQVAAGNYDGTATGEWLVAGVKSLTDMQFAGYPYESRLQVLDGSTYSMTWDLVFPGATVVELLTEAGDVDTAGRFYLGGYQQLNASPEQPTYLYVAEYNDLGATTLFNNEEYWGDLYGMTFVDYNLDESPELFMGTTSLYQLRSTDSAPIVLEPDVVINPGSLEASHVVVGQLSTETLTISNLGGADLTYTLVEDDDDSCQSTSDLGWFSIEPTSSTVAIQSSQVHTATFDSSALAPNSTVTGYLCLQSNDPDEPVLVIPLSLMVAGIPTAVSIGTFESESTLLPQLMLGIVTLGAILIAIGIGRRRYL